MQKIYYIQSNFCDRIQGVLYLSRLKGNLMQKFFGYAFIPLLTFSSALPMRRCPHVARESMKMSAPRAAINRVAARYYSSAPDNAERQKAWEQVDADVAHQVKEWKAKAAKHQALSSKHIKHARAYAALASLEEDKLTLFKLVSEEVNEAALYPGEIPNFEKLTVHMELITKTYDQFKDDLPEDDKI